MDRSGPEACDGADTDCDGTVPTEELDADGDGYLACDSVVPGLPGGDCDDADPSIHPGAAELCDGVDTDCNGLLDFGDIEPSDIAAFVPGFADPGLGLAVNEITVPRTVVLREVHQRVAAAGAASLRFLVLDVAGASPVTLWESPFAFGPSPATQVSSGPIDIELTPGIYWIGIGTPDLGVDFSVDPAPPKDPFPIGLASGSWSLGATGLPPDAALAQPAAATFTQSVEATKVIEVDFDLDGFLLCGNPADCGPFNGRQYPGAAEECDGVDTDCDGFLPPEEEDADEDGWLPCDGDCDDTEPAAAPFLVELCDFIDNDCDGLVDEDFDQDGDGFFDNSPEGCAGLRPPHDCDDFAPEVYPGAVEVCNFIDEDCDGDVGETWDADGDGWPDDTDGDGLLDCDDPDDDGDGDPDVTDCQPLNAAVHYAAAESCNFIDDDCDGLVDEGYDNDGDGFTICAGDCDDGRQDVFPGAPETCDGIDQDCDGDIDEDFDGDGDGVADALNPACSAFPGPLDCDDGNATTYPGAPEICDGQDNDCDLAIPSGELDLDADGFRPCDGDCDDSNPTAHPGALEICDGVDNDCVGGVPASEVDADGDGFLACGEEQCVDGDLDPTVYPGAPELCDWVDSDCDGSIVDEFPNFDGDEEPDCVDTDADSDNFHVPVDCDDFNPLINPDAPELCDGIDSDCDTWENCPITWAETQLSSLGAGPVMLPSDLAVDAFGRFHVAWTGDEVDRPSGSTQPPASAYCQFAYATEGAGSWSRVESFTSPNGCGWGPLRLTHLVTTIAYLNLEADDEGLFHAAFRATLEGSGFMYPYVTNRPEAQDWNGLWPGSQFHGHGSSVVLSDIGPPSYSEATIVQSNDAQLREGSSGLGPPWPVLAPAPNGGSVGPVPTSVLESGGAHRVVFSESFNPPGPIPPGHRIYETRKEAGTTPWSAPSLVGFDWPVAYGLDAEYPSMAVDPASGALHLVYQVGGAPQGLCSPALPFVWEQCAGDYDSEIFYQFHDGLAWSAPVNVSRNPGSNDDAPSITIDGRGQPHVVWRHGDAYDWTLHYSFAQGALWQLPAQVGASASNEVQVDRQVVIDRRCGRVAALRLWDGTLATSGTWLNTQAGLPILPDIGLAERESLLSDDIAFVEPTIAGTDGSTVIAAWQLDDVGGDPYPTVVEQIVVHASGTVPALPEDELSTLLEGATLDGPGLPPGGVPGRVYGNRIIFGDADTTLVEVASGGVVQLTLAVDPAPVALPFTLALRVDAAHDLRTAPIGSSEMTCSEAPILLSIQVQ